MNLFALTDESANRVVRIPLADPVRNEIEMLFGQQEAEFRARSEHFRNFDGKYKPEYNECLVIENFDDLDNISLAPENVHRIPRIAPTAESLGTVKALFFCSENSGKRTVLLQAFQKRRVLSTGGLLTLVLSAESYTKFDTIGLTIDDKLSAILENGKLNFFSFFVARQIFDLTNYYQIATDQDIKEFLSVDVVHVKDQGVFDRNVDTWVRSRIALIKQSGVLESVPVAEIKRIGAEFGVDVPVEVVNGLETIPLPENKAELKKLLRFLDEDYYKSSLRRLPHMTNSKVRL